MADQTVTKRCCGCKAVLPADNFHKNRHSNDGLSPLCKPCMSAYGKLYRQRPHYKEYDRRRGRSPERRAYLRALRKTPKVKATIARCGRAYNLHNKGKQKARHALNNAIYAGRFPRATTRACQSCGQPAEQYYHHNGYDPEHWFDVIPLCRACHHKAG